MLRLKYNLRTFIGVIVIGLLIYSAYIYVVSTNTTYKYPIELWNYGVEFLHLLYPLIFSIPFCWLLFYEKNGAYWIAETSVSDYEPIMTYHFYGTYQLIHPIMYALILSGVRALLAVLYTCFGIGLTLIVKNVFIALTGAFVYSIAENFITAILQVPELSICTTFYPNRLSNDVMTLPKLMVGPCVMVLAIITLYILYLKKEKQTLLD